jgi:hypothetical protein
MIMKIKKYWVKIQLFFVRLSANEQGALYLHLLVAACF